MAETPKWQKNAILGQNWKYGAPKVRSEKVKDDMYSIMRSIILKEIDEIFF
jgi:hypothetical protein